jgi:hypothetical protein
MAEAGGLNPRRLRVRIAPRARARSPTGRDSGFKSRPVQVRSLPRAPIDAPFAKRPKASVLHTDISEVRILDGAPTRVFSSAAERLLDTQEACGSIPRRRTIRRSLSSIAERAADNRDTAGQNRQGLPTRRTIAHERSTQTGSPDPERKAEWRGSGLLTRPQEDRNLRGPPFTDT